MARDISLRRAERALTILAAVALASVSTLALYWARVILIPIALAVLITFVLSPLVVGLQRRGLGKAPSVVLVVAAGLLVIGTVGVVVGDQMVELTKSLPDHADRIKAKVAKVRSWVSTDDGNRLGRLFDDIVQTIDSNSPASPPSGTLTVVVKTGPSWATQIQGYLSPAAEVLGQAALTFILVTFMLLRREDLRNRAIRLFGPGRLTATTKAVDETSRRLSRYLLAQFLLNSGFGVIVTLGLLVIGVPYAPLWGFVGFLMRYVPYIGTWIGVIPPAVFTFAITDGWGATVGVLILFLGLEALFGNFVEPVVYGPRLGLSEVAQLVATAFWAFLWGPVGIILAWPLTTCLLMLGKYVPQLRFLNVLLGDEPVLSPRLAFYQRLAARDHDEAVEIVEKELGTRSIEQVLDDLLIPALSQAKQDSARGLLSDEDLTHLTRVTEDIAEDMLEAEAAELETDEPPALVLVVPAKDPVDHVASEIFGRVLRQSAWTIEVTASGMLTSELAAQVQSHGPAAIVIVAVSLGECTQVRFLCKRLRSRFPELKIFVACWAGEDPARLKEALGDAGAVDVFATLEATSTHLAAWRAILSAEPPAPASVPEGKRKRPAAPIGTVPA
jgi:predicted PurR-regulated permease PerM